MNIFWHPWLPGVIRPKALIRPIWAAARSHWRSLYRFEWDCPWSTAGRWLTWGPRSRDWRVESAWRGPYAWGISWTYTGNWTSECFWWGGGRISIIIIPDSTWFPFWQCWVIVPSTTRSACRPPRAPGWTALPAQWSGLSISHGWVWMTDWFSACPSDSTYG